MSSENVEVEKVAPTEEATRAKVLVSHPSDDPKFSEQNKICLVMITRDGACKVTSEPGNSHLPVILRAITSVLHLIDSYCICDTGSVDGTPELIEEFMLKNGKPGYVIFNEWKNYGTNKTYLLEQAYRENLSQNARYLLWLDTDETFLPRHSIQEYEKTKNPDALLNYCTAEDREKLLTFADAGSDANNGIIMLQTLNGFDSRYYRWQMCRNNQQYTWELPAHETFEPPLESNTGHSYYEEIVNLARKEGDGPKDGKSNKAATYAKWYKEWLAEPGHDKTHRHHSRVIFYLAQSSDEAGNIPDAIQYYKERLDLGGSYQEKYIARIRLCQIYKRVQAYEEGLRYAAEAEKMCPNRLEAYSEEIACLDALKKFKDAYVVGIRGLSAGKLNPQDLFISHDLYEWRFLMQVSLMAHYSGNDIGAYNLGKQLMEEKKYPSWFAAQAQTNFTIFEQKYKVALAVVSETKKADDRFVGFTPLADDSPIRIPHNKVPDVIIIDDFLENPDEVRAMALKEDFSVKGNYPGGRTKSFATLGHKAALERIIGRRITYWPDGYNGSIQYAYGTHKSWVHRDQTDRSGIIFLTPNAPADGGTVLYRHKLTGATFENPDNKAVLDNDSNDLSKWEVVDRIGNKYNRLVIFNGRMSHMSDRYWGSSLQDCRMFMLFFFNLEK